MLLASRISPVARLSFGLIALIALLLILVHLFLDVLPSNAALLQKNRQKLSESLAVQLTSLVERGDRETLARTLQSLTHRGQDVVSAGVRRANGTLLAEGGGHRVSWLRPSGGRSTLTHVIVPIYAGGHHWGDIEVQFVDTTRKGVLALFDDPAATLIMILSVPGLIAFYLYLRRALQYLDPTAVIPERVRVAFDTLTEGVMVLDAKGRVVLVNKAFRRLHPNAGEQITGHYASKLRWLVGALPKEVAQHPWNRTYAEKQAVTGCDVAIAQDAATTKKVVVNAAPVLDGAGRVRGCMVTFDDVSELDRANAKLRNTLQQLEQSQQRIAQQNDELQKLALRDPLTSCLNRRAFIGQATSAFNDAQQRGEELSCIMGDIDHFKSYNDRFGHAVGDQVIIAVAQTLQSKLGEDALLCRYGGEEFCILLPNTSVEQAMQLGERIRAYVESSAASKIAALQGLNVTSSFGASALRFGSATIEQLIDQADQALYNSKKRGRNRVSRYEASMALQPN